MDGGIGPAVVIDIANLCNSLEPDIHRHWIPCRTIGKIKTASHTDRTVHHISESQGMDFSPVAVSIGPYHHGTNCLQQMERKKWDCLRLILNANHEKTLNDYLKSLWELYPIARSCYTEEIDMEGHKFVEMLLLDTCFIIVSICGLDQSSVDDHALPVSDEPGNHIDLLDNSLVKQDLLLLENQIPFVVIQRIFEVLTRKENTTAISEKMATFVEENLSSNPIAIDANNRPREFCHLLHLCHMYFRPSQIGDLHVGNLFFSGYQPNQWQRAEQYYMAGVKFEKREHNERNPHSLLDVSFRDEVLYIPYILIDEITAVIFKNLIALEQTNPQFGNDIMAYVVFLSQLVSDVKDVGLFVGKGIIGHQFGSNEEVLSILSNVTANIVFRFEGDYYLKSIHQSLEAYYESRMKLWGGNWLRNLKATPN